MSSTGPPGPDVRAATGRLCADSLGQRKQDQYHDHQGDQNFTERTLPAFRALAHLALLQGRLHASTRISMATIATTMPSGGPATIWNSFAFEFTTVPPILRRARARGRPWPGTAPISPRPPH